MIFSDCAFKRLFHFFVGGVFSAITKEIWNSEFKNVVNYKQGGAEKKKKIICTFTVNWPLSLFAVWTQFLDTFITPL